MATILVITSLYPPYHSGGYELSCRDVVDRWRLTGHEVVVLTCSEPGSEVGLSEDRALVRRDLRTFFADGRFIKWSMMERLRNERHNRVVLDGLLAEMDPDVVSVWHMAGIPMSLLTTIIRTGRTLVCVVCDEWPGYVEDVDPWMRVWKRVPRAWRSVETLSGVPTDVPDVDRGASFCFVSHNLRDRCLKRSRWFFPRSTVTYSGINTDEFPLVSERRGEEWAWRLVTAGRLDPVKGFATAIRALTALPEEVTLEILSASDSGYRHELESLVRQLGLAGRVRFCVTDRNGVREKFVSADAVIFPSEWEEPFGLVPLEAMACATPVMGTVTGGSSEFMTDGRNCLQFRPGDAAALASCVRRLAESPVLRARLIDGGRATAKELTVGRLANRLEEWHLAAAADFGGGVPGPPADMRTYRASTESR